MPILNVICLIIVYLQTWLSATEGAHPVRQAWTESKLNGDIFHLDQCEHRGVIAVDARESGWCITEDTCRYLGEQNEIPLWIPEKCNLQKTCTFRMNSQYARYSRLRVVYTCLPESTIHDICRSTTIIAGSEFYLKSPNFPHTEWSESTNTCSCTAKSESATLLASSLVMDMDLYCPTSVHAGGQQELIFSNQYGTSTTYNCSNKKPWKFEYTLGTTIRITFRNNFSSTGGHFLLNVRVGSNDTEWSCNTDRLPTMPAVDDSMTNTPTVKAIDSIDRTIPATGIHFNQNHNSTSVKPFQKISGGPALLGDKDHHSIVGFIVGLSILGVLVIVLVGIIVKLKCDSRTSKGEVETQVQRQADPVATNSTTISRADLVEATYEEYNFGNAAFRDEVGSKECVYSEIKNNKYITTIRSISQTGLSTDSTHVRAPHCKQDGKGKYDPNYCLGKDDSLGDDIYTPLERQVVTNDSIYEDLEVGGKHYNLGDKSLTETVGGNIYLSLVAEGTDAKGIYSNFDRNEKSKPSIAAVSHQPCQDLSNQKAEDSIQSTGYAYTYETIDHQNAVLPSLGKERHAAYVSENDVENESANTYCLYDNNKSSLHESVKY